MSAVAGEGGFQFEIKMAALIGLRGLKRGDNFELSSNVDDAGNFDDLVYTAGGQRYFLQLKHTSKPDKKKLTKGDLVKLLKKCFESYRKIRNDNDFVDNQVDKMEFIIYTNKELGDEISQHELKETENDIFFMTCERKVFNVNQETTEKESVYTLFKKSVMGSETSKESQISEFLKELIIVTGQKGHRKLNDLIVEEIIKHGVIQVDLKSYFSILHHFKTPLETWWRNTKRANMTPKMVTSWLQRAKTDHYTPVVRSFNMLLRRGIKFSKSETLNKAALSNKSAVHVRSDALTLCSILLLDCLPQSKCIFVNFESLQSNKIMLLYAWLGGHWEWLIVSCDSTVQQSDISKTCVDICRHITPVNSNKHFIILTHCFVQEMQDFTLREHKFKFEQLSKNSKAVVLDKKIDFQGCEVTMRSVLQRRGNVEHVLGPELVTDLITEETAVNIGGKLPVNTGYYAPRVLERKVWLQLDVLRKSNDVFAVSGAKEEILKIVPSGVTVEFHSLEEIYMADFTEGMRRIFLLSDKNVETTFMAICEKLERKPLHWVEFNNGDLLWKMSRGGTDSLLDYVDVEETCADKQIIAEYMKNCTCEVNEDSIWDLGERAVLVVAEPGMGKSSTTTHVAWHTKLAYPTSWVVRINWNDHTRKLQEINAATLNLDTLVEFLCSTVFPDSKYPDINSSLLKQALQSSGNVTVLMDGFDEISPTYADKAAAILSELMETKVERVWVTSRPVQRERLEELLRVPAFTLKKLSKECQEKMLRHIWEEKSNGNTAGLEVYMKYVLKQVNESVYPRNLTGCPLHIKMIASAFEESLETYLESRRSSLTSKLNLLYLYDTFVESKLHIYEIEKKMEDLTNASVQDDHERLMETFVGSLEKCSLLVTVPSELHLLHDETIEQTTEPFVRRIQAGKDKTGIVMNVVEGKPQFVHRTFAEYFTARWFSENIESNRSVLEHILFDPKYSIVTDMFDRMLVKDCPLHCAVLDWDMESVETLLQEGFEVNAVDKGGRSAMHIIAAKGHGGHTCEEITNSLLRHGAYVDAVDNVLQWTPLRYAIETENWFVLYPLLENL